jgi:hypothetical protein
MEWASALLQCCDMSGYAVHGVGYVYLTRQPARCPQDVRPHQLQHQHRPHDAQRLLRQRSLRAHHHRGVGRPGHESLQGNAKALATVTAIIDGMGSLGAAVGPVMTGYISDIGGFDLVFAMLYTSAIAAGLLIIKLAAKEVGGPRGAVPGPPHGTCCATGVSKSSCSAAAMLRADPCAEQSAAHGACFLQAPCHAAVTERLLLAAPPVPLPEHQADLPLAPRLAAASHPLPQPHR